MTKLKNCLVLLLTIIPALTVWGQTASLLVTDHYTTSNGLPSNNVYCAMKDRDGFLWFGTWYGLCRFDGSHFETMKKSTRPDSDIPPRKIESMAEDQQGNLWLKTVDWKVYVFYRRTGRFHALGEELKHLSQNMQVIKLQATDNGQVLLLTKDKNLLMATTTPKGHIDIKTLFSSKGKINPFTYQLYRDYCEENNGYSVWVGRDYRIFAVPRGKQLQQRMADNDNLQQRKNTQLEAIVAQAGINDYVQIYEDNDRLVWVTTPTNGIYCIHSPKSIFKLIPFDFDQTGVRSIFQLPNGNVLVGTRSRDVFILNPQGQRIHTFDYKTHGIGAIYHVMADKHHRLWLSTKRDGLVVATPDNSQPTGYRLNHYLHDDNNPQSISGNAVYMTYTDKKGHIWVATLDGGLNLVKQNGSTQLVFYNRHNGFINYPSYGLYTEVRNMAEDQHGRLWIGTIDGLMSTDTKFRQPQDIKFETYKEQRASSFANNDIYTIFKDNRDNIWMGAFGGGLSRLTNYDKHKHCPDFKTLGMREGLRNDVIVSITEDLNGRLWFAGENTIACYNPKNERIRNFDKYDGLPDVKFEEASACRMNNGEIWLGCKQGIIVFDPKHLVNENSNYHTFITNMSVNNRNITQQLERIENQHGIDQLKQIELKHDQNSFTIEFAALNFINNNNVAYRYRLKGYDHDWNYSGQNRQASYTKVPPGNYTFVVETIDDSNPTLCSRDELHICILPPWWATWWAYLIYLAVIGIITFFIVRTGLQMNRMRNEMIIGQRLAKLHTMATATPAKEIDYSQYVEQKGMESIDQLHRIIDENLQNSEFNIDTMAAEMGLSRSAFFKKVKNVTGFAPLDLIKEFRLSRAAELLKHTNLSINEVAYRSGFKDSSYFGKCFRKRFGLSPRDYASSSRE